MQLVGHTAPEVDANAVPVSIGPLHGEGGASFVTTTS